MNARAALLDRLSRQPTFAYSPDGVMATEPASFAAMCLLHGGHTDQAEIILHWLVSIQADDGSVGVTADQPAPRWTTSLACLAWRFHARLTGTSTFAANCQSGIDWILGAKGLPIEHAPMMGHDTRLGGGCWAVETHSWLEPTALHIMALKSVGHHDHSRTREGIQLLMDRQLADGGCNYGNTTVMGQQLLPHVQPTGIAMSALINEPTDSRIDKSLNYLEKQIQAGPPLTSRCFAMSGLAAHGRWTTACRDGLKLAYSQVRDQKISTYKLSLLYLASLGPENPLLTSQYELG